MNRTHQPKLGALACTGFLWIAYPAFASPPEAPDEPPHEGVVGDVDAAEEKLERKAAEARRRKAADRQKAKSEHTEAPEKKAAKTGNDATLRELPPQGSPAAPGANVSPDLH